MCQIDKKQLLQVFQDNHPNREGRVCEDQWLGFHLLIDGAIGPNGSCTARSVSTMGGPGPPSSWGLGLKGVTPADLFLGWSLLRVASELLCIYIYMHIYGDVTITSYFLMLHFFWGTISREVWRRNPFRTENTETWLNFKISKKLHLPKKSKKDIPKKADFLTQLHLYHPQASVDVFSIDLGNLHGALWSHILIDLISISNQFLGENMHSFWKCMGHQWCQYLLTQDVSEAWEDPTYLGLLGWKPSKWRQYLKLWNSVMLN